MTKQFQGIKLFVATPMYGGQCFGEYMMSCIDLFNFCKTNNIHVEFHSLYNESLITRGRNVLVNEFLSSDCTHLMFIDADIKFNTIDIIKMIDVNKDIICGIYPLKYINWENVKKAVNLNVDNFELKNYTGDFNLNLIDKNKNTFDKNDPFEIKNAGTGFMLIKKEVFNKLKGFCPKYKDNIIEASKALNATNNYITEYFSTSIDPEDEVLLSEDYHFCYIARKQGIKIWAAPWADLTHIGTYHFEGRILKN